MSYKKYDPLQEERVQSQTAPWWPCGHGGPGGSASEPVLSHRNLGMMGTSSAQPDEAPGSHVQPLTVASWGTKCWLSFNFLNVDSYIELAAATLDSSDTEESIINSFKHECPKRSLTIDHEPVPCPVLRRAPRLPGPQGWCHADLISHKPPLCPVRKPEHEGATRSSSFSCSFWLSWSIHSEAHCCLCRTCLLGTTAVWLSFTVDASYLLEELVMLITTERRLGSHWGKLLM